MDPWILSSRRLRPHYAIVGECRDGKRGAARSDGEDEMLEQMLAEIGSSQKLALAAAASGVLVLAGAAICRHFAPPPGPCRVPGPPVRQSLKAVFAAVETQCPAERAALTAWSTEKLQRFSLT